MVANQSLLSERSQSGAPVSRSYAPLTAPPPANTTPPAIDGELRSWRLAESPCVRRQRSAPFPASSASRLPFEVETTTRPSATAGVPFTSALVGTLQSSSPVVRSRATSAALAGAPLAPWAMNTRPSAITGDASPVGPPTYRDQARVSGG